ncbi:MAG: invasion associated locus B family protein [Ancalomicrobiaceae bacterium]|nr:invasion associated locus B family protein [Ancalomicrobiaceae bacterium]
MKFPLPASPRSCLALAATILLTSATIAAAAGPTPAPDATPQATSAIYRDWQLHCVTGNPADKTAAPKTCEVAGVALAGDGKGVAARVVLGRPVADKPVQLVIQLAPGVWLPTGATFTVPGVAPIKAEFKQCVQVCFAQAEVDAATVTAMKSADRPATISFQDANRQAVSLPVSLNGFAAAEDASKQ